MTDDDKGKRKPSPIAAARLVRLVEGGAMSRAEDAMGDTDCPEGCIVEPDGWCPHDYESAGLTAEVI
jgi:hypothetical protein